MEWAILVPVLITAIIVFGIVLDNWVKARHGYPLIDDKGNTIVRSDDLGGTRQIEILSTENAGLKGQVGRLEERIAVLERIATDPAARTALEIENLR